MKIKYLGDISHTTYPSFMICRKIGEDFEALMYKTSCRAFLWDVMYETIYGLKYRSVTFNGKIEDFKDSVCIAFGKFSDLEGIQKRIGELETKLKIPSTKFHVDGDTVIFEANPLWITNLTIFSLYLATIRYSNAGDKYGFDETIKNFDRIEKLFNRDKGKERKEAWVIPKGHTIGTHYLGIHHFHSTYK